LAWNDIQAREALRKIFDAAVGAADPRRVLAQYLPPVPSGRCVVVGAGKSAAVMAAALEEAWPDVPLSGTVVTRYAHAVPTQRIEVIEASHPVPDENSEHAARQILEAVQGLGPEDLVLALMSGGGSALMVLPAEGLTGVDKQAVNRALLRSGATISEMNAVRKHLSAIKGGRLAAAAAPARVITLAISDVPGDEPEVIGSGPTVPDATTYDDVRALVARYRLDLPPSVAARLAAGLDETPKPGAFPVDFRMIATPSMALTACAEVARHFGLTPLILGDALEGESRRFCYPAGRALSPSAAVRPGAAGATPSFCWLWPSALAECQISGHLQAIPMGLTAPKTLPAPSWRQTRWRAPEALATIRALRSRLMIVIACLMP
jgi:hydroxypyruvate reductase